MVAKHAEEVVRDDILGGGTAHRRIGVQGQLSGEVTRLHKQKTIIVMMQSGVKIKVALGREHFMTGSTVMLVIITI